MLCANRTEKKVINGVLTNRIAQLFEDRKWNLTSTVAVRHRVVKNA